MRILCAVMGCGLHASEGFHQAQRETWGADFSARIGEIKFFVGRGSLPLAADEVRLDVPDNKETLLYKVAALMNWALENGYDSVLKVNTNTYVNVEQLAVRRHWEHDYAGAPIGRIGEKYPATEAWSFIQGSASWLSARAIRLIAPGLVPLAMGLMPSLMPFNGRISPYLHSEDLWIGQALRPHLPGLRVCCDGGYGNGPVTYWSQSNYVKRVCLGDWMRSLHEARPDPARMDAVQARYRSMS